MKQLGNLLSKRNILKTSAIDEKSVFFVFEKIISDEYGNQGTSNIRSHMYKDHKLFVKTFSSNWANELWLNKRQIIKKLNGELGSEEVTDLALV